MRRESSRRGVGLSGASIRRSWLLAARALGPQRNRRLLPYRTSNPDSEADGRLVAAGTGIAVQRIDITPQVDAYFAAFADAAPLRRGNKMARERMTILYDQSAALSALVLGTSNKTELFLGYGTIYGDCRRHHRAASLPYAGCRWRAPRLARRICQAPSADLGQEDRRSRLVHLCEVDSSCIS